MDMTRYWDTGDLSGFTCPPSGVNSDILSFGIFASCARSMPALGHNRKWWQTCSMRWRSSRRKGLCPPRMGSNSQKIGRVANGQRVVLSARSKAYWGTCQVVGRPTNASRLRRPATTACRDQ
jgi:hypothetical protein